MVVVYQIYKKELPECKAEYIGHIPSVQKEEFINLIVIQNIFQVMDFVSAIKSENK